MNSLRRIPTSQPSDRWCHPDGNDTCQIASQTTGLRNAIFARRCGSVSNARAGADRPFCGGSVVKVALRRCGLEGIIAATIVAAAVVAAVCAEIPIFGSAQRCKKPSGLSRSLLHRRRHCRGVARSGRAVFRPGRAGRGVVVVGRVKFHRGRAIIGRQKRDTETLVGHGSCARHAAGDARGAAMDLRSGTSGQPGPIDRAAALHELQSAADSGATPAPESPTGRPCTQHGN